MFHTLCLADLQWDQALFQVLIWGGVAVAALAFIQLLRGMFAVGKPEDADAAQRGQNALIGFVALGCAMAFGGFFLKSKLSPDSGNEFKEFVSTDGRFKVKFPGSPKTQTQGNFLVSIKMFLVENKDEKYGVAYLDVPGMGIDNSSETRLNSARDAMLKAFGAKKKSEARISLEGKYPGREIHADVPDQVSEMYASFYLVKQRAYMVLVTGKSAWLKADNARKFLNSFALIN